MHEGIHVAAGLMPNLLTQRMVTCFSIMVIELVSPPVPRAAADLASGGDHRLDQLFGDLALVALHVGDFRAVGAHRVALLIAERIREHKVGLVTERGAHKGKRDPRRPRRILDNCSTRR